MSQLRKKHEFLRRLKLRRRNGVTSSPTTADRAAAREYLRTTMPEIRELLPFDREPDDEPDKMSERLPAHEWYSLPRHEFLVYSRPALEATHPPSIPHAVISITGPEEETYVQIPANEHTTGIWRECFPDVPRDTKIDHGMVLTRMDRDQADRIVLFARQQEDAQLIICQCFAGVSRSSAIAVGLQLILDHHLHTDFSRYMPNLHVVRMILNAGLAHLD